MLFFVIPCRFENTHIFIVAKTIARMNFTKQKKQSATGQYQQQGAIQID